VKASGAPTQRAGGDRHPLRIVPVVLAAVVALISGAAAREGPAHAQSTFAEARIFIEYNASDNDLGFHVSLDGEDWQRLKIVSPNGRTIFEVEGKGPYRNLGLTELFFEGAEPSLDDVPLDVLLALFPEGNYKFIGVTVEGARLESTARLTHAIPAGPEVSATVDDHTVTIRWKPVTGPPGGFPDEPVNVVGYQVIVGSFQVTLPASSRKVTVPREFVKALEPGEHGFEVLAIEAGGNQTITAGSFETK
jgi:hypothetical protein